MRRKFFRIDFSYGIISGKIFDVFLRRRKIASAISLIAAFALGQGSLFLASSYLLFLGLNKTVTDLGISASLYSLVIWISDFGGVFYLSAYIKQRNRDRIRAFFYARLLCVLLLLLIFIPVFYFFDWGKTDFSHVGYGAVLAFLSCLGFGGVYDGIRKTSSVAIYASLPWVFSALSVLFLIRSGGENAVHHIGLSFLVGHALYVIRTFHVAYRFKLISFPRRFFSIYSEARGAVSYLFSYASGQFYARALLIAASGVLDQKSASYFVYSRQIYSAVSQVVLFLRRAEGIGVARKKVLAALFAYSFSTVFAILVSVIALAIFIVGYLAGLIDKNFLILFCSSSFCLFVWAYFNKLFFYYLGISRMEVYLVFHSAAMLGLSAFVLNVSNANVVYYFPLIEAFVLLFEIVGLVVFGRMFLDGDVRT